SIIENFVPQQRILTRRFDSVGGDFGDHGQNLTRSQRPRGFDRQRSKGAKAAPPIPAARTDAAGKGRPTHRTRAGNKLQAVTRGQNRKAPEIPGDVPVELRLAVEPTDLPAGSIAEDISMLAVRNDGVLAAGVNTNDAVFTRRGILLRLAVTLDAGQNEIHLAQRAAGIFERQRKVPVNAVPDVAALGLNPNRFCDGQFTVFGKANVGVERLNDFGWEYRAAGDQPKAKGKHE